MTRLAWRNDADGFAFVNSWSFDANERSVLAGLANSVAAPAAAALVGTIFPEPTVVAAVFAAATAASTYPLAGPLPTYGMCGGMAYLCLDHWLARQPLPRGAHPGDQPARGLPVPTLLRDLIWRRLLDSLGPGNVLRRTVEWSLLLNQVPPWLGGGAGALLARTRAELAILRARIDAGRPVPIGLIYFGRNVWDQHQILVYGYVDTGPGTINLLVCDSNAPHRYGETGHDRVFLNLNGPALVATSPSDTTTTPPTRLAGFFCSDYVSMPLPGGLAAGYGGFLRWPGDGRVFQVVDGARMPVASPAELAALGGDFSVVRTADLPFSSTTPSRPRDGALFRERSSAPVFLYQGGAPFHIPDPDWLMRFGGWGPVRVVPDGTLAAFAGPPDEQTLLREWNDPRVWRILSGQRRWVTSPAVLARFGGFGSVRLVPDGALAGIPEGLPLF